MNRLLYPAILVALAATSYRLYFQPLLATYGVGRVISSLGTTGCTTVPALVACEKIVLHAPTGVLYLACSSPESRAHWTPPTLQLNASGPDADYLATYDPQTGAVARLKSSLPGIMVHGMDVVSSASDPAELFIYAVNHRKPADRDSSAVIGADSTIEVFKTAVGSTTLTHLRTVRDPVILTPNDIVGSPDGKSFFFTNDHNSKTSMMRFLTLVGLKYSSVGYCDVDSGCKLVTPNLHAANGIVRATNNDTFYVGNSHGGGVTVFQRQEDNALLKTHTIPADRGLDNLSMDTDGVIWAASFPDAFALARHIADPSKLSPSSAHAIAMNTGPGSFYGEKFKVTKVFEDDGTLACGTTTVVHDVERKRLYLHGIASPHLTICPL
ncbi:Serum paraoxonase/arylesterase 2 [Mycena sanguinolenta]|uniref:Serum paraoxonase/arylesterase 2 n=1 Tax=Mycena sanguinolenta TaxID=230812 RepID=A0A8H6ZEI6_9AGAR|nr:Serum paraoxonase/arylesterase 2 [Mycena sanguinolenta]